MLVPLYPGINCAMGMLQTAVRHSYLRSEVGVLSRFPAARMQRTLRRARARRAGRGARGRLRRRTRCALTRLVDLRYPHQGYTLAVECKPGLASDDDKAALKRDFDALHGRVYGQSAPREDAEIVTFRLQSEIDVPQLELPRLDPGDGNAARALTGERPLYDIESDGSFTARIYDRAKLKPGDRVIGPAVIEQFDATTLVLSGHAATVDPFGIIAIEAI